MDLSVFTAWRGCVHAWCCELGQCARLMLGVGSVCMCVFNNVLNCGSHKHYFIWWVSPHRPRRCLFGHPRTKAHSINKPISRSCSTYVCLVVIPKYKTYLLHLIKLWMLVKRTKGQKWSSNFKTVAKMTITVNFLTLPLIIWFISH